MANKAYEEGRKANQFAKDCRDKAFNDIKDVRREINPYDLNSVGRHTDKKLRRLIH